MTHIPDDLSGMAAPVPHYRDITAADTARDRLYASLGNAVNVGVGMALITWAMWGISVIAGWLP